MILVTGATGLVGGHLIWELLQENHEIIALKRKNSNPDTLKSIFRFYTDCEKSAESCFKRVIWREGDVTDYASLLHAFEHVKYVYHCAAMVSLGKNNEQMLHVNKEGTKNVVNAALKRHVKKVCFVSSIAALSNGNSKDMITEDTPRKEKDKSSIYGESKRLAEKEIEKGKAKGLETIIVNPGVILGYSEHYTGSGELFKRIKRGMPFYTNGVTGYVAVLDVAKTMILLMNSNINQERFIIVGENNSHKAILQWMAEGYGKLRPFIGMNKSLPFLAWILEFTGKTLKFTPPIDTMSAKITLSIKHYSNQKFLSHYPDYQFKPIKDTILEICKADKNGSKK